MSPWLISPAIDLAVLICVSWATLLPWLAADIFHLPASWVLAAVALANGPHLISTWTRVYLEPRERFRRPIHYWVVPALAAAFAIGCFAAGGAGPPLVRTVIFY